MRSRPWLMCLMAALWFVSISLSAAQSSVPTSTAPAQGQGSVATQAVSTTPLRQRVLAKLQEIGSAKDTDSGMKARVLELYRQADAALQGAELSRTKIGTIRDSIDAAPQERAASQQPVPIPDSLHELGIDEQTTREVLEQQVARAQSSEAAIAVALSSIERQISALRDLPRQARTELAQKREQLATLEAGVGTPSAGETVPVLAEAERLWREAQLEATSMAIALLNQELLTQDGRRKDIFVEQDRLKQSLDAAQATVTLISERLIERRREEATLTKRLAEQTRIDSVGKHPAVIELANENAKLTARLDAIIQGEARVLTETRRITGQTQTLEADLKRFEQRLEIAGLSHVLGKLFVERRKRLREPHLTSTIGDQELEGSIIEAGLGQLQIGEARSALDDKQVEFERLSALVVPGDATPTARRSAEGELLTLLNARAALLKRLQTVYGEGSRTLGDLEFSKRQYEVVSERFKTFLDNNSLWIPNLEPIGLPSLTDIARELSNLGAPSSWQTPMMHFIRDASQKPLPYLLIALLLLILAYGRGKLRAHAELLHSKVGHLHTDRFTNTLKVAAIVLIQAGAWPALLAVLGWRLGIDSSNDPFSKSIAASLQTIAVVLFPLLATRGICEDGGLAEIHFRWTRRANRIVRKALKRFAWVLVPVICLGGQGPWVSEEFGASTARISLILIALMLMFTVLQLISPTNGALGEKLRGSPDSVLNRTRWIWLAVAVTIPLSLAVLSAMGYQFTATQLIRKYYLSLWLIALAYLIHEFGVRWLELTAARMAWRRALAARPTTTDNFGEGATVDDPMTIDFKAVNQQSLRLFSALIVTLLAIQLWANWSAFVPALGVLDEIQLWDYTESVGSDVVIRHITLANLLVAGALAVLFAIAVPSVPRLFELVVYQRINLSAGTLNAITTILRYL
ncbi:MAG: potassium efflux system protein, partial [Gammaproteobacteria bacterium]